MKKLACPVLALILVMAMAAPGWSVDMTGKWGISLFGGAWKQALTDHSDFWTVGWLGSAGVKYGLNKNIAVGANGYWMQTYIADLTDSKVIADGAGLTIDNLNGGYRQKNYLFEATAEYHFLPDNEKFSPYVLGGAGIYFWAWRNKDMETLTSDSFQIAPYNQMGIPPTDKGTPAAVYELKDQEITVVGGAGFEWFPIEQLAVNAGGKFHFLTHLLTDFKDDLDIVGTGAGELDLPLAVVEAFAGVTYYVGAKKDSDKDGITDDLDQCPDTPLGAVVDASGCPLDADGDGVYDGLDQCPDTPKGAKVDMNGCPMDADGDGVYDGLDQCPNTPKEAKVDSKGCPLDADGDGVPDYKDNCANTPKACKVDQTGCPVDSDGDGVCDGVDRCPNTPAERKVDDFGCPISEFIPEPEKPVILYGINFETNKATLKPDSKTLLEQVAASLKERPDVKVEIGGHADSRGSDQHNMTLSQARAESVRDFLISLGVPAAQLTAMGYGETLPIGDNNTEEGRAKNRRVELKRIQ